MTKTTTAGPIVKWAGGKTRILPHLIKRLPATFRGYHEPFAGGAALFFHLAAGRAEGGAALRATLGDMNHDLIEMYREVAHFPEQLILELRRHHARHSQAHFYAVRERWNAAAVWPAIQRAAAFIYLNKACFNGLWRVNRSGHFNVPMGRYASPTICEADKIRAASPLLRHVFLKTGDYRATNKIARGQGYSWGEAVGRDDLVYFDPPYDTGGASFTGYTANGFNMTDQAELAVHAQELFRAGAKVMISNADTKLVREMYKRIGFRIHALSAARSIAASGSRESARELIVTSPNIP